MLSDIIKANNISLYKLSKETEVSYTTLSNIKLNKVKIENVTCDVVNRLAKYFDISMDTMYKQLMLPERKSFEWFRSEVCHKLKFLGDKEFVIRLVEEDYISIFWEMKWYAESLYLLAMLDILSKKYNAPLCTRYDYYRTQKLKNTLYPLDILIKEELTPELKWKEEILKNCNPEFLKYNIVEGDIYDVVW